MNLLVDYMSCNAGQEDFRRLFAEYGHVTSVSILECHSSRSKLSAIVKMAETPIAGRIISARLNRRRWRGGCLYVYMPLFFQ